MAAIQFTLMAILIPILMGAVLGFIVGNIFVGLAGSVMILGWIAGELDNQFITSLTALILMIMAVATARQFVTQIMGDTS